MSEFRFVCLAVERRRQNCLDLLFLRIAVEYYYHCFAEVVATVGPFVLVNAEFHKIAVNKRQAAFTYVGDFCNCVACPLFVLVQLVVETHHAAAVGVVRARIAEFVAIVNYRYARNRHVESIELYQFVVCRGVAYLDVAQPSCGFRILVIAQVSRSVGYEPCAVVVACDITHKAVAAVEAVAHFQNVAYAAEIFAVLLEYRACFIGYVKVELGVKHTGVYITLDKLRAAVRFSYLVKLFALGNFHPCFQFVRKCAPEIVGNMLAGIVAETVKIELCNPLHCRVGLRFQNFRS